MVVSQANLVDRMVRAAKADVRLFEEVERDESATSQAAIVVAIVSVATALGVAIGVAMLGAQMPAGAGDMTMPRPGFIGTFISQLIGAFVGWIVWSYITYFIGTRVFNGTATPGEMLRCIGFAQSPRVLGILGFIPILGGIIQIVLFFWAIYVGFIAVRQALDLDNTKAILTIVISAIAAFVASLVIGLILLPLTMMGV